MFNPSHSRHAVRAGLTAVGIALALPAVAAADTPVNLATALPFAVLGGQAVTNTGPSVLNGDLGVAPGTSLVGFGLPATVNGATHANDAVAQQAQADLANAYDVAAAEPVSPSNDLTGTDLGNRTLQAGSYGFSSSAGLTGALTLDAAGDANAQFVFVIGSTLTTASASSVNLINGASPCNVFWKIGSSATLGSTTSFAGNLMALSDISLNNGVTVQGRVLARNGQISLINDTINPTNCPTPTTPPPSGTPTPTPPTGTPPTGTTPTSTTPTGTTPTSTAPAGTSPTSSTPGSTPPPASAGMGTLTRPVADTPPASRSTIATRRGTATLRRGTGSATSGRTPSRGGVTVTVKGTQISKVVYTLDGRRIATKTGASSTTVKPTSGRHTITARVTFKDATRPKTLTYRYRVASTVSLRPTRGPSQFTG